MSSITRGILKYNYNLKHLTWLKVGGNADVFFKPEDEEDLILFLKENNGKMPLTVIGAGSNLIISDAGVEGVVIKLGKNFTNIELINDHLMSVGSGCLNFNLAKFCLANSIAGFEFLVGIPGTIGGGIAMNAGAYGMEFKDVVNSVEAIDKNGNIHVLSLKDIGFSYRSNLLPKDLIFTKIFFNVKKHGDAFEIKEKMAQINSKRSLSQPITEKTGGSTFANPPNFKSWELIDKSGLRGAKVGGACMSELHCNFMINYNDATAADMENLGELIIKKVKQDSGIELKWEIKKIGRSII